jgi:8-oxo-dGTP pyrophosphatase MutT (NUDIX family)
MSDDAQSAAKVVARLKAGGIESLRARLMNEPPVLPLVATRGDFDLNPHTRPLNRKELRPAAVLVPLVQRPEPTVLLTQRTHTLAQHAGQVAFPGGRAEPHDVSLIQTALRETEEETGIQSSFITIAGFLDAYETGTGFAILPVVGLLAEGFALMPDASEVAEVFEVPLAFLLDPANRKKDSREFQGVRRSFYSFTYEGHYIWGATAAMLVNFGERLKAP